MVSVECFSFKRSTFGFSDKSVGLNISDAFQEKVQIYFTWVYGPFADSKFHRFPFLDSRGCRAETATALNDESSKVWRMSELLVEVTEWCQPRRHKREYVSERENRDRSHTGWRNSDNFMEEKGAKKIIFAQESNHENSG